VYSSRLDAASEVYFYTMEFLSEAKFSHMNTVDDPAVWSDEHLRAALDGAARLHAQHLAEGEVARLTKFPWIDPPDGARMERTRPVWQALLANNQANWPELWGPERGQLIEFILQHLGGIWRVLDHAPKTLIHNDFNPRNVALRRPDGGRGAALCAYDWELATVHVPQRDVVEFLSFVLPPGDEHARDSLQEFYRTRLELHAGRTFEAEQFALVTWCALADLGLTRLQLYGMVHSMKEYNWLERVLGSCFGELARIKEPLLKALQTNDISSSGRTGGV